MTEVTITLIVLAVAAILAFWALRTSRRHAYAPSPAQMREKYGPEFDLLRRRSGSEEAAARELERREERVSSYELRALTPDEQRGFQGEWVALQARFIDDPQGATLGAEALLARVMRARGYPLEGFDRSAEDLSVDHARFVDALREAHGIALATREGRASTEDLRRALMLYRAMFADLLAH